MVAIITREYLVAHGGQGELGRFQSLGPVDCRRGERVVIQGQRGLEIGEVLCEVNPRHQQFMSQAPVGSLLRHANGDDEQRARKMLEYAQQVFTECRRLARAFGLALEVIDVEVTLDGQQATVAYLGAAALDLDEYAAEMSRRFGLFIFLHNLALTVPEVEQVGCDDPNCGRTKEGGCTSCESGGGCATGCGSQKTDLREYFAHLRGKMEKRDLRPLL